MVEPTPTSMTPGSAADLAPHAIVALLGRRVGRDDAREQISAAEREQRHLHREHFLGPETGAHLGQPDHRAREQSRAREQHDGHGDLRHDEPALQPLLPQDSAHPPHARGDPAGEACLPVGSDATNESSSASATDSASVKPSTTPSSRISFARGE